MTDQTETPEIPDEAKFVGALGINPDTVEANTVRIIYNGGRPFLTFTAIHPVSGLLLAQAFAATIPATDVKQPQDRKPPAKRPAKKAVARKPAK